MKKYIPVLLFVALPFYYSCVSRQYPNYSTVSSSISATNNGVSWSAFLIDTLSNDSLILHAKVKRDLLRIKFFIAASSYNLTSGDAQYFLFDNSGNITNTFKLDQSYANTISSIVNNMVNYNNKYITGQFKARFIIDSTTTNTGALSADTVTFVNGQFTAVYK